MSLPFSLNPTMNIIVAGALTLVLIALAIRLQLRHATNMPPGPTRGLFGDNRRDVPLGQPWKTFTKWHREFGDVISLYLGTTPVIVLGSLKSASDLLEKRGNIYSSRPRNVVGGEILSGGMRGIGMPYGTRWRNWRALMHAGMSIEAAQGYQFFQSAESKILLRDLLTEKVTSRYSAHLRRFAVSVVFCVGYGRRVKTLDDDIVLANQKIDQLCQDFINMPGQFLVESWPILLALPRALQWFRREPEKHRAMDTAVYMSLMDDVKARIAQGTAHPSIATRALDKQATFGLNDVETAYALSAPWSAGVGTTMATLEVFILAMLLHPSAMKKAQAELNSVVGPDRLPDFKDSDTLPYIHAVFKETMRWRTIAPTGVPHAVTSDDVYNGMFIPKGSTVFANLYVMTQDPKMFPEPDLFWPERFIDSSDPKLLNFTLTFGFGRRICPGMHIAQQSLFILISRILWAFDIVPVVDDDGRPVLPSSEDFTIGLVRAPKPFGYSFRPRRDHVHALIQGEADRADLELQSFEI